MNIKSVSLPFIFGLATFVGLSATALSAKDNMYFHGILVDEPCTIKPGDETVELDFGNIPDKNCMPIKEHQVSHFKYAYLNVISLLVKMSGSRLKVMKIRRWQGKVF